MIIKKQVVLREEDILAAIKLYLDEKNISVQEHVCSFIVRAGDTRDESSITVYLSDEETK